METPVVKSFSNKNEFTCNFFCMKYLTFFKTLTCIVMIFFFSNTEAQNYTTVKNKYRVTAFQKHKNHISSLSNEVEIIPSAVFYIPNAFTPNGDGLNETFGLIGEGISEYKMQIFNKWGNLVFESDDVKNAWDGNYQNVLAPIGVYVYKIVGKGPNAGGQSKRLINESGTVTLIL